MPYLGLHEHMHIIAALHCILEMFKVRRRFYIRVFEHKILQILFLSLRFFHHSIGLYTLSLKRLMNTTDAIVAYLIAMGLINKES